MGMVIRDWSTKCVDWEDRIVNGVSLIPGNIRTALFEDEAERALRIFKRLKCPDIEGFPTYGEICDDWVFDLVRVIFGSYDVSIKRRMIREFFLLIPKKNGKSTLAAAIMVVAAIMNHRPAAELLLIAPTIKIAERAFGHAHKIIQLDPALTKLFHAQPHNRTITHRKTLAVILIKSADKDVITGSLATFILIDETHVFAAKVRAAQVFLEIRGSLASRPDGFLIQITTQSKETPSGVFKEELQIARDVRDGKLILPLLMFGYELPVRLAKDNGWENQELWPLVNPNYGRSVDPSFLIDELIKAKSKGPVALALYASQHFNVEIGIGLRTDGWAGAALWPRGAEKGLTFNEVLSRSEVLTNGIDGGGLDDLLGVFVAGREKGTGVWLTWAHAFISPEGWERRKANQAVYQDFINDGDLTLVERLPDDVTAVVDIVRQCLDSGKLAKVGCDPAGLGSIVDELAKIGVTQENELLVGVRQGVALMGAIKTVERKLADGSFKHGGRRMMAWCAGNAIVQATGTGMRIARDASGYGKVDPLMAGFDAVAEMSLNPKPPGGSYLDEEELLVL
jgi:phage terminase large subunit-like protein